MEAAMPEYLWLVVVGAFAAFAFGWGTGANDVANAFGTSVGAKTLTLKQAVILAAIFEFTGALVLGRVSTSVIAGGIADITYFYPHPEIYAYGMICALTVGFAWQAIASYYGLNVSATHSIIGGIMGFSLVFGGTDAVLWAVPDKKKFPPFKGVAPIIFAWFFSPVLTALSSGLLFWIIRTIVLRHKNAYQRAFWVLPPFVILTTWLNIYFVFTKGASKTLSSDKSWNTNKAAWVAACCAAGLGFLTIVVVLPILKYRADKHFEAVDKEFEKGVEEVGPEPKPEPTTKMGIYWAKICKTLGHGLNVDIHADIANDPIVSSIHENAEVFEPRAEFAFAYLQVFSAICVIFSHGAGEVGYMAGPLATVWDVYRKGTLSSKTVAPIWIIIIGALGLVVGLATYGYNVTRAVGTQMAKLSPSRGFAAELSTAMVIMIAAQYGLPTSSSQCITGGIVGVGMVENLKKGVNWRFFLKTWVSWVCTLFIVGGVTGALFAQGVYSPSATLDKTASRYESGIVNAASGIFKDFNSTLYKYQAAAGQGSLAGLSAVQWQSLNKTLASDIKKSKDFLTYKKRGTLKTNETLIYLYRSLSMVQQYTINTLGQDKLKKGALMCNDQSFKVGGAAADYSKSCVAPSLLRGVPRPANATTFPAPK